METVANLINDAAITRALLIQRIGNGLSREVVDQYQSVIDEIVNRIKTSDDVLTMRKAEKLIKEMKEMVEVNLTIYDSLEELGSTEAAYAATMINTAVGVDIVTSIAAPSVVERIVKTSLIEGATIKQWFDSLDASMKVDLERTIKNGVTMGSTTPEIVEMVKDRLSLSKSEAESITRTAIATVSNQARDATWKENEDIFKGYEHVSVLDNRTSKICGSRDGAFWDLEGSGLNEKGKQFKFLRPPLHFRCRSILLPVVKDALSLGIESTRASIDGQVSDKTTFEEWFESKQAKFQEEYLGKGRYQLYRYGKITFSDLVNQNGRELTLSELRAKYS